MNLAPDLRRPGANSSYPNSKDFSPRSLTFDGLLYKQLFTLDFSLFGVHRAQRAADITIVARPNTVMVFARKNRHTPLEM